MSNFLDVAESLLFSGKLGTGHKTHFERVFRVVSELQQVHSKSQLDLINIESIFTTFEMARILGRLPGTQTIQEIDDVINSLKWLIVLTLEQTVRFRGDAGMLKSSPAYSELANKIREYMDNGSADIAVLTFNYDLAFDLACLNSSILPNYHLGDSHSGNQHRYLSLLKLHGSLNWLKVGETITPWHLHHFLSGPHHVNQGQLYAFNLGSDLKRFAELEKLPVDDKTDYTPFIVPPSWNKADSHKSISAVWKRAAKELSEAKYIYIAGYSLPDTDSFFRQLYALGSVGVPLKRFMVFNPDPSREAVFKNLLGPGARDRFTYYPQSFDVAIHKITPLLADQ